MKRLLTILTLAILMASGCLPMRLDEESYQAQSYQAHVAAMRNERPQVNVTADQVTEANAHAMARALEDEIEFESRRPEVKTQLK